MGEDKSPAAGWGSSPLVFRRYCLQSYLRGGLSKSLSHQFFSDCGFQTFVIVYQFGKTILSMQHKYGYLFISYIYIIVCSLFTGLIVKVLAEHVPWGAELGLKPTSRH